MNAQTVNAHRGMLLTLPNVKSRSIVKRACAALPLCGPPTYLKSQPRTGHTYAHSNRRSEALTGAPPLVCLLAWRPRK